MGLAERGERERDALAYMRRHRLSPWPPWIHSVGKLDGQKIALATSFSGRMAFEAVQQVG
jgi:hypothetical protein